MSELCREFGITRKTGYKLRNRYTEYGPEGLFDRSRRPVHSPRRLGSEVEAMIVETRKAHPTWGPLKLREYLSKEKPALLACKVVLCSHLVEKRAGEGEEEAPPCA